MSDVKEKLLRVLQILWDTDEHSPINATGIVERLENRYGLGKVNRHSIYQDIAALENCGYDIKQCKDRRKGWYLKSHDFEDWEICLLIDAATQTKCLTTGEIRNLRTKLLKHTSERGRKRFQKLLNTRPAIENEKTGQMGSYVEILMEAIYREKKIEFQYTEINANLEVQLRGEGRYYCFNPYAMYWGSDTYYVLGMHDNHEDFTSYRLDRIRNLQISNELAVPARERLGKNADEVIKKRLMTQVFHYGGEETRIVLEYIPEQISNAILYDFAGKDIRVRKACDGRMRAFFYKQNSITLRGWLLQHAAMFEVIEPAELREEIIRDLIKRSQQYGLNP